MEKRVSFAAMNNLELLEEGFFVTGRMNASEDVWAIKSSSANNSPEKKQNDSWNPNQKSRKVSTAIIVKRAREVAESRARIVRYNAKDP